MSTITALLVSIATFFSPPAGKYLPAEYQPMVQHIKDVGVELRVNTKICNEQKVDGYYKWEKGKSQIVICQGNATDRNKEVQWTKNDLDTLRHEVVHLMQDCNEGVIADGKARVLLSARLVEEYSVSIMPFGQHEAIMKAYKEQGATDYEILQEIEAFLVAGNIELDAIMNNFKAICPLPE